VRLYGGRLIRAGRVERNVKKIGLFIEVAYPGWPQSEERKEGKNGRIKINRGWVARKQPLVTL
jgi:hypothetical protein